MLPQWRLPVLKDSGNFTTGVQAVHRIGYANFAGTAGQPVWSRSGTQFLHGEKHAWSSSVYYGASGVATGVMFMLVRACPCMTGVYTIIGSNHDILFLDHSIYKIKDKLSLLRGSPVNTGATNIAGATHEKLNTDLCFLQNNGEIKGPQSGWFSCVKASNFWGSSSQKHPPPAPALSFVSNNYPDYRVQEKKAHLLKTDA